MSNEKDLVLRDSAFEIQTADLSKNELPSLEQYLENGSLKSGMPLKITYMGKKKNKTNNFQSDNWSVRPLRLNLPVAG